MPLSATSALQWLRSVKVRAVAPVGLLAKTLHDISVPVATVRNWSGRRILTSQLFAAALVATHGRHPSLF
jgi:hypothetical protein